MKLRQWLHHHSLKLLAIRDTPNAIAGGVAFGFFFGCMPIFGLKNLSAIFCSWLTRCNILAAVLGGLLHDVTLPLMPVIYLWEYQLGCWLLGEPSLFSKGGFEMTLSLQQLWREFVTLGKPLLLGSVVFSAPQALLSFFVTRAIVVRHQRKKQATPPSAESKPA
jgi:uncharacterized protein (DUF2062 family)